MLVAAAVAVSVGAVTEVGLLIPPGQRSRPLMGTAGRAVMDRGYGTGWLSCLTTVARRLNCPILLINFNPSRDRADALEPLVARPTFSDVGLLPAVLIRVGRHHIDMPPPTTVHD
jgi:hypothetical protein